MLLTNTTKNVASSSSEAYLYRAGILVLCQVELRGTLFMSHQHFC